MGYCARIAALAIFTVWFGQCLQVLYELKAETFEIVK